MKVSLLKRIITNSLVIAGLGAFLVINGCAAKANRMIPEEFEVSQKHLKSVKVNNSIGGKETNPLWTSQISNTDFTYAVSESLIKSEVFQTVLIGGTSDYILDVTILHYNKPWGGLDFNITIKTSWILTDSKTNVPAFSKTFETSFKTKVSDALIASQRLQMANEGAVRENIKKGIRRLSLLDL